LSNGVPITAIVVCAFVCPMVSHPIASPLTMVYSDNCCTAFIPANMSSGSGCLVPTTAIVLLFSNSRFPCAYNTGVVFSFLSQSGYSGLFIVIVLNSMFSTFFSSIVIVLFGNISSCWWYVL